MGAGLQRLCSSRRVALLGKRLNRLQIHLQTVNTFGLFCLLHLPDVFKVSLAVWNIFACIKSSRGLSWLQDLALKKYHQKQLGKLEI